MAKKEEKKAKATAKAKSTKAKNSKKKATKSKAKAEKATKKKKKTMKEVPAVLRADSMVDVMHISIDNDEEAPDKIKALPKKDLRYLLDLHNATIFGHVARGGKVQFMPYITYGLTVRLPRKGRNPRTGEELDIPGSLGFSARAGKGLKELVNSDKALVKRLLAEKAKDKAEREARKAARDAEKAKAEKKSARKRSA